MQLSILILSPDRAGAKPFEEVLASAGHGVTVVTKPDDLVAAAPGYSVVIVDGARGRTTPADAIASLKAAPASAAVPVLGVAHSDSLEDRIGLLEAGADEVISRPFQPAELLARVEAMSIGAQQAVSGSVGPRGIGDPSGKRVIAVFSPKGGVGTTTIATNLALLAAERGAGKVLLVDLDLSFGQVSSHLNLRPKQSLLELSRDEGGLREMQVFRTYPIQLPGGLHVLAAPPSPSFSSLINASTVDLVMERAVEAYEVVVVDAGTSMDDRHAGVFGRADTVIVPVLPEIPALNAVHLLVDQLSETGTLGRQTMFVLNNAFARELLKRVDIEGALGATISVDLPYDPIVYLKAVNEGVPVVLGSPRSQPAEKLRALASIVFGGPRIAAATHDVAKRQKKGLFGRG